MSFEGFDFSGFWEEHTYFQYDCGLLTPEKLSAAEAALGCKLPASYVRLMETRNGGVPVNTCFPTPVPTNWAEDHIAIETIFGVGAAGGIVGETRLMREEWGYPAIGVAICDCPTGGHQEVFLDYRKRGPQGEPEVVYVDQEDGYSILRLAENFEEFIRGLASRNVFEPEDEDE